MALCILGSRAVFSRDYGQIDGCDSDALVDRVKELLAEKMPQVIWLPDYGQVGVEHTSLRAASDEYPLDEVEDCIRSCWEQAAMELTEMEG